MVLSELRTGAIVSADGTVNVQRADKTGATVCQDAHARFQEAVLRGAVYTIQSKTTTVTATTDISPLPATTGRAGVALYNPPTSGVNLVIWKVLVTHVSGTPGGPAYLDTLAGALCTNANKTNAINNLTQTSGGHKANAYTAAVPANTAAAVMFKPLGGSTSAVALGLASSYEDLIDGSIIIPPGAMIALSWHATGTTHIYSSSMTWEEVAV